MFQKMVILSAALCGAALAATKSAMTQADWLSTSLTYTAGQEVQTALRLVIDEHWHTYWSNPGAGGMKLSVKWELPAGWTAGTLEYPVPKRFMTGELPGFGYEGTVIFPVKLTAPAGFTGPAVVKGKFSWLTCNEEKCLTGSAALELHLTAGAPTPTPDVALIDAALAKIPQAQESVRLNVRETGKSIQLTLTAPSTFDATAYEAFPLTPEVIDPAAPIAFVKQENTWSATVPKSEYATLATSEFTLILAGKSGQAPLLLPWTAK